MTAAKRAVLEARVADPDLPAIQMRARAGFVVAAVCAAVGQSFVGALVLGLAAPAIVVWVRRELALGALMADPAPAERIPWVYLRAVPSAGD